MKTQLMPYLNFNGNCREAMQFYRSIFGGELSIQTFGDAGVARNDAEKERTMHAMLKGEDISFMASDGHPDGKVQFGNNIHLSLNGSDEAGLAEYFNKLSEGGKITMSLSPQFWGDTFGMLTDKFGVNWMVNISKVQV